MTTSERTVTLRKSVAAIQVFNEPNGRSRMGDCVNLPKGAQLKICGHGFSERTVQVAADSGHYVVVLDRILH